MLQGNISKLVLLFLMIQLNPVKLRIFSTFGEIPGPHKRILLL